MVTDQYHITNEDNIKLMKQYADNFFDLAIVDPPYTNDTTNLDSLLKDMKGKKAKAGIIRTDSLQGNAPTLQYWEELERVSKARIVWGVNWYDHILGPGRIVWHKDNEGSNFSDCELAYNSLDNKTVYFKYRWNGMLQGDMKNKEHRIHPTQKPVKLYEWLLKNYAQEGNKILDTHLGSGSIAIAIDRVNKLDAMKLHLTACELDKEYYEAAVKRIKEQTAQQMLGI